MKINDFEIIRDGQYGITVTIRDGKERWEFDLYAGFVGRDDCELQCDWEHLKANGDKEWGDV